VPQTRGIVQTFYLLSRRAESARETIFLRRRQADPTSPATLEVMSGEHRTMLRYSVYICRLKIARVICSFPSAKAESGTAHADVNTCFHNRKTSGDLRSTRSLVVWFLKLHEPVS
jgi:hypothetical protein